MHVSLISTSLFPTYGFFGNTFLRHKGKIILMAMIPLSSSILLKPFLWFNFCHNFLCGGVFSSLKSSFPAPFSTRTELSLSHTHTHIHEYTWPLCLYVCLLLNLCPVCTFSPYLSLSFSQNLRPTTVN